MPTPVQINDLTVAASSGARFVKGESCRLTAFSVGNPNTGPVYIQCFDSLIGPTVGTTVPKWSLFVPTGGVSNLATDVYFRDGLWVAASTTDDGSTAPTTAVNASFQV